MKTGKLDISRGIKVAFELEMLLKAAGELSFYCCCHKTLSEKLRATEALEPHPKWYLTRRNVLQTPGLASPVLGRATAAMCSPPRQQGGEGIQVAFAPQWAIA